MESKESLGKKTHPNIFLQKFYLISIKKDHAQQQCKILM